MSKEKVSSKLDFFHRVKSLGWKVNIALFLLGAIDAFSMAAPYYIRLVLPNVQDFLGLTPGEYSQMISIIGWVTLATQIPGGWLADKISSKKMIVTSAFLTGVLTAWFGILGQIHNNFHWGLIYDETTQKMVSDTNHQTLVVQYIIIYVLWGFSTTLLFWTPLWKLNTQQVKKEDQGLAYGLQGAYNGILGVTLVWLIGMLVTSIIAKDYNAGGSEHKINTTPFAIYAYLIASYLIIIGILIIFYVYERKSEQKFSVDFKVLVKLMGSLRIWLTAFFVMGMYMFQSAMAAYLLQYITNIANVYVNGATIVPVAIISLIAGLRGYGLRMLISGPLGRWADKLKSYIGTLMWVLLSGIVLLALFWLLPLFSGKSDFNEIQDNNVRVLIFSLLIILYLVAGVLSWAMVTLRYATIGELPTPKNSYATTNALISFVAFSPDAWFYLAIDRIAATHPELTGKNNHFSDGMYRLIIGIGICIALFGWVCGLICHLINKSEMKRLGKTQYRWRELHNE